MTIVFVILVVLSLFLGGLLVASAISQHDSDPAGNALSSAFAVLVGIALWVVLAVLLILAGAREPMPAWSAVVACILVPASGWGVQFALHMMSRDRRLKWPVILPAAIPALLLAYALYCYFPAFSAKENPLAAGIFIWSAVALLTPLPWLVRQAQARAVAAIPPKTPEELAQEREQAEAAARQQRRDTFAALTPDSPLRQWWSYTEDGDEFRPQALAGAARANSRQQEIPRMLAAGQRRLFLALPDLDLTVTPEIVQGVRDFLADQVANLRPFQPDHPQPATFVTDWFTAYFPTIRWLLDHQGHCNDQLTAIAAAVGKYPDSPERQRFLASLESLRQKT